MAQDSVGAWTTLEAFRADPVNAWVDPSLSLTELASVLKGEGKVDAATLADRLRSRLPSWVPPRL